MRVLPVEEEVDMTAKTDAENLTPAQKAARTRAANKAAAEAESLKETVGPIVDDIVDTIKEASESEFVQVTVSRVTPKFPSAVRDAIYTVGIWLGVLGTIATPIAAVLTGDAQFLVSTVGTVSLALTNALAKLNLSKTAKDLED